MTVEQMEQNTEQEDTIRGRFLTFTVDEEMFGVEIRYVTEIINIQPINVLPEVPEYIKGIINLRGKIIPVVDMRIKLKKEAAAYTDRTCIVVIQTNDISAGLIVDQVAEVLTIEDIEPPPDTKTGVNNHYLSGIGKTDEQIQLLIDCELLFSEDKTQVFEESQ